MPIGAEPTPSGTSFRVWAPRRRGVIVVGEASGKPFELPLERDGDGYFGGVAAGVGAGSTYRFRLDRESTLFPDPASRFQPEGPHGPSMVIDSSTFSWTDNSWKGVTAAGQVIYELHVGTFTPEGTWAAAAGKLEHLATTGITLIEVMPVADFAGTFGWGYDGVDQFAPTRLYGIPDDFRAFVDRAHGLGIGVILDVVYNHFGPDGNYLKQFSEDYFTSKYKTDWGEAVNYDGKNSGPVREFVLANVRMWIEEYHLDGLRLDATQNIYDDGETHILRDVTAAARKAAAPRTVYVVAENEPQETHHVESPDEGGYGMDALWNDDLHHSIEVALTGRSEAYYTDYRGTPQEFVAAAKWGYLYQGQWYHWQKKPRGTPALTTQSTNFVAYTDNHDQVANSARGARLSEVANPALYRAMMGYVLLGPATPMLFQGQEFGASSPFFYFADHHEELAPLVEKGRLEFLAQFPSAATPEIQSQIPAPHARTTFERCKLDWTELGKNQGSVALVRDLLEIRRDDEVISTQQAGIDGAVLSTEAFLLRYFAEDGFDRLFVMNLGIDADLAPIPEPLLAPPMGCEWELVWSSEDPKYGGLGTPTTLFENHCHLPAHSALLFAARLRKES